MRRGLGRGRTLIAAGSVAAIIAMWLPWITVGGVVLSTQTANGFEGAGVATFLAAVAMLAVVVLPYTTRSRQVALDRALVYLALVVVGVAGLVIEAVALIGTEGSDLGPTDAPGLWLAGAGMLLATWGVLELIAARPTPA